MAPDLNSVPVSPRNAPTTQPTQAAASSTQAATGSRQSSTPASRRASQIYPMSPPPLPLASPGGSIPASAQHSAHPFPPLSPNQGHVPSVDAAGVPMRHPRPLTAAELHLELEKEQEAVVCSGISYGSVDTFARLQKMGDLTAVLGQPPNPRALCPSCTLGFCSFHGFKRCITCPA
jgi:hypothetical protein